MRSERFTFPNAKGEQLAATLDLPLGKPTAFALFAHCFTCGKDNLAAKRIAERLTIHGIAVLRFDFTGLGASEGEFANTHFSSNVDDLVAAADHLRKMHRAPAILIGHSLGGAAGSVVGTMCTFDPNPRNQLPQRFPLWTHWPGKWGPYSTHAWPTLVSRTANFSSPQPCSTRSSPTSTPTRSPAVRNAVQPRASSLLHLRHRADDFRVESLRRSALGF